MGVMFNEHCSRSALDAHVRGHERTAASCTIAGVRPPTDRRSFGALLLGVALATTGCALPRREAKLPEKQEPFVAVLSGEMPPPISKTARHAWIILRVPGERRLVRYEYLSHGSRRSGDRPLHYFGDGEVAVHGVEKLDATRAVELAACFERASKEYAQDHPGYFPIPGPNSNTYVDRLLRRCGVRIELPATAVGRDYRGIVGASVTESGTGVQLESIPAGVRVGLVDGVEAHLFGLALGVHAWPPAITVPVNPGRIGVDTSTVVRERSHRRGARLSREAEREQMDAAWLRPHTDGVGVVQVYGSYDRVRRAELAGGLSDRFVVGASGRALFGKRMGWAMGLDLELGAGFPAGFAYRAAYQPLGVGWALGPTGFFMVLAGVGTSGVTARVPAALEIPTEMRLEVDAGDRARVGLRSGLTFIPTTDARRTRSAVGDDAAELTLAAYARVGRLGREYNAWLAEGTYFALERREIMGTYWLGVAFGVELDAAR